MQYRNPVGNYGDVYDIDDSGIQSKLHSRDTIGHAHFHEKTKIAHKQFVLKQNNYHHTFLKSLAKTFFKRPHLKSKSRVTLFYNSNLTVYEE